MKRSPFAIEAIRPDQVWRWSQPVLFGALTMGCAVILLSAWASLGALLIFGALLAGLLVFGVLARSEVAMLSAVLAGFVLAARYEEGFQLEEVLYGVVYLSYLGYWYVSRLFFYRDNFLRSRVDWALFLFLIYVTLSLSLTPILGGDMQAGISQWLSVTMLAFYFPVREICIRRWESGAYKPVLFSMGFVAGFIAIRNFLDYKRGFEQAEYLWQIATGRVVMNEHILMMAGLVTLTFLLYSRHRTHRLTLAFVFITFSVALILGQSRASWVSFALGVAIIFFFVDRRRKLTLVLLGFSGLLLALGLGAALFDNFFTLIVAGLTDRLFSLQSAAVEDISLINRFIEMGAAWEYIKQNPVVGYGFGVPIKYYSLVFEATRINSFIHNAYVGVLYRHGLIGFVLLFGFYFGAAWTAFRAALRHRFEHPARILAIAALACLAAEALVANTQNPFATADYALIIAVAAALGSAAWHVEPRDGSRADN